MSERWWQHDRERLARELALCGGNSAELARKYGLNRTTLNPWIKKHGINTAPRPQDDRFVFPQMGELCFTGDWMLTSDWHLPIVDYSLVDRMVNDAIKLGVKNLCIAGDWFNFDALSDYMPKQSDAALPRELQDSNRLMDWLLDVFEVIVITLANHDVRLVKTLGYRMRFDHSMRVCFYDVPLEKMARVKITNLDYVIIDSAGEKWRVCHSNSYSKNQLVHPSQFAEKYRMNVASGHRHHHAIGFSTSGYRVLELGGLFDTARTEYLQRWTNSFPRWQPGYSALIEGRVYCPMLSDHPM